MTNRERIRNVFKGQKVHRIPWIPLCYRTFFLSLPEYRKRFSYEWWGEDIPEDLREEELKFRVEFYRNIGADFMQWGGNCINEQTTGVEIKKKKKDNNLIFEYETPEGDLEQTFVFTEESQTLYRKTCLLKSEKDFNAYRYILEHTKLNEDFSSAKKQLEIIGENGVIFASGVTPAIHSYVNDLLGIENLVFLLSDRNKELKQLFWIQEKLNMERANLISKSPFEVFVHQSIWDIGRISPAIFEEYYSPSLKEYNKILHKKGKICLDHLSGQKIRPFWELIEDIDFDGIYGFVCPVLEGDIPFQKLIKRCKGKIVPIGGLDPHFLVTSKPNEIKDRVKRIIEDVGDNPFILGTADAVVYGTSVKNLEIASETIRG